MAEQVENIKWVPGTRFMVDGFRFQSPRCQVYLLTHFHSDHTTGRLTTLALVDKTTANIVLAISKCCCR